MLTSRRFNYVLILVVSFLVATGGSAYASVTGSARLAQATPSDGARRITPAELRDALEKGQAVLVDVRGEEAYRSGHIKGARTIPWDQLLGRLNELPHDKLIVTYCS